MPENDSTPKTRPARFKTKFRLTIGILEPQREIPTEDAYDAASQCLFYVEAIITLLMMLDSYRVQLHGHENFCSLLLTLGELSSSLCNEIAAHLEVIDDERRALLKALGEKESAQ